MTLRERIEARRAALLSERAIAEAADEGPWAFGSDEDDHFIETVDGFVAATSPANITNNHANFAHIAAQDPAATIARVDRELADIDADLALLAALDDLGQDEALSDFEVAERSAHLLMDRFEARYPEDDR